MALWHENVLDDVGEPAPYVGLGPEVIPVGTRRDAVVSVLVGLVAGVVLVFVLWLVAVWTVGS